MPYRKTSTKVTFDLIDETAKDDASFSYIPDPNPQVPSGNAPVQSFCNVDKLSDVARQNNYMTNELNYSVLDGIIEDFFDEITHPYGYYAFVSSFASNSACGFDNDYFLRIIFDNPHTSNGITITFDNNYLPDRIRVEYYDTTNINHTLLNSKEFSVKENTFFCNSNGAVNNYREIRIHFISTKYPNSLIKMSKIEYGVHYVWQDGTGGSGNLVDAEIYEETDILSNTLAIGTCRFTVYSDDDDFNIDNPNNIYNAISKNQKVGVYEIIKTYDDNLELINTKEIFMGQYYLREWRADSKYTIVFNCIDIFGVLDEIKCENTKIATTYSFGILIQDIVDLLGMGDDIIQYDPLLYDRPLVGLLPLYTCREAIQAACFAVGAYASCSRRNNILISLPNDTISENISDDNNFGIISSSLNPFVTGIMYSTLSYVRNTNEEILCKINMEPGNNQVILIPDKYICWENGYMPRKVNNNAPFTIKGFTEYDGEYMYMLHKLAVDVRQSCEVAIKGYTYKIDKSVFVKKIDANNFDDNIIDISNISIYEPIEDQSNRNSIPDRIFPYYGKRNVCEYEFRLSPRDIDNRTICEQTGGWCLFKNMYGDIIKGSIFSMNIDLTGGFIATTKLVFCENISPTANFYICGDELLCGENVGII